MIAPFGNPKAGAELMSERHDFLRVSIILRRQQLSALLRLVHDDNDREFFQRQQLNR